MPRTRLAWLDLLRGFAALIVALHHATQYFTPRWRAGTAFWFDPGLYGVLVFFLVSGYIVPASLERHGRVRDFWVGRVARIHPLLSFACLITLVPFLLGARGLRAGLEAYNPATAVLAHVTMLQDVLGVPNVINVLWTLSYEMLFYLMVVALFVTGTHRRSAGVAALFVVAAVVAGGLLPIAALTRAAGTGPVVVLSLVVLLSAIGAAVSDHPGLSRMGGVAGGVLAIVLAGLNGRLGPWEGFVILAVMFTGTAIYRAEHGQISKKAGVITCVLVLTGAILAGERYAQPGMTPAQADAFQIYWAGSVLLAALTFAVGWLLRHRRIPAWLTGLGVISFSVYVMHPVLLMLADQFGAIPDDHDDVVRLVVFVLVLITVSRVTYRYVEVPFQRLGRRLTRREAAPAPQTEAVPARVP